MGISVRSLFFKAREPLIDDTSAADIVGIVHNAGQSEHRDEETSRTKLSKLIGQFIVSLIIFHSYHH
jgi:hypothetical protein